MATLPFAAYGQVRPETIRGRVTNDSGVAIRGATIAATMAPDRLTQQSTTDSTGRYAIYFGAGTGDYLLYVGAVGYKPFRKRVTRTGVDTSLTGDAKLTAIVTQLASVTVTATKLVPIRGDDGANNVGSPNQQREGVHASLSPDQEGDIAAIANALPGMSARADGLSAFGLAGNQSNVTVNGMAFDGASIPRAAARNISVASSPYDPSRGGFSGAQTNVQLSAGGTYRNRGALVTLDAPVLQATDGVGDRFGSRYTNFDANYVTSGSFKSDRYYHSNAVQVTRRQSDAATLFSMDDAGLAAAGIAPDSVRRLQSLLSASGIPFLGGGPPRAVTNKVSFSSRIDRAPYLPGTRKPAPSTWNVATIGTITHVDGLSLSPLSTPSRVASRTGVSVNSQATYSHFFGDVLNEFRTALNVNSSQSTASLRLPGGRVLVSSVLQDESRALAQSEFGGNSLSDFRRRSWTWQTVSETMWYPMGRPHRIKLSMESRIDGYSNTTADDVLGTFVFPSLGAFAASQPSEFSRALNAPSRSGAEWSGFLSLGDYWRVSRSLQFLYGARVEGNHFTTKLLENSSVASTFGEHTSFAPNRIHVSPRVGFNWAFGKSTSFRSMTFNQYATQTLGPVIILRGGIGEFRNLLAPSLLGEASASNGLPGSVSRISCIGSAAPAPKWQSYLKDIATIPSSCVNGAPSALGDQAATIRVFDRSYDAARSWRANLTFQRATGPFILSLDGVYSLNLDQPGTSDLNFSDVSKFTLSDEARPVFVTQTSIVPATGAVSSVESRKSVAFGQVRRYQSDLRSISRQLTFSVTPNAFHDWIYGFSYTLGDMNANARGFDGATFGSPTLFERTAGTFDVRHQIQASFGRSLPHTMNIAIFARLASGVPYTPYVSGDVNGDGLLNDRAFVFDPSRNGNPAVDNGMRALLAAAPAQAADCLRLQLNTAARRNSCRGPWTAYMNARIGLLRVGGWTRRTFNASLNVSNPLTGIDQLLHGADHMQGWGGSALPDQTLLIVRGFDPAANRFRYEVNPRFGSTRYSQQTSRAPFRVTIDMAIDLGVPIVKQQAIKLLSPGRRGNTGPRMSTDSIRSKLKRQVRDVYALILEQSDSLLLSREQAEALKAAQMLYQVRMDSLWVVSADRFASVEDDFDENHSMHMLNDAIDRGWIITRDELPTVERILSPLQIALGPDLLATLKAAIGKKTVGIRIGASF